MDEGDAITSCDSIFLVLLKDYIVILNQSMLPEKLKKNVDKQTNVAQMKLLNNMKIAVNERTMSTRLETNQ